MSRRAKKGREDLHGLLVVNKEAGPTSNRVLQTVRRLLGGVKAGHAGTLDPAAEGVLLICLGQATKIVPFLGPLEKEYIGRLGFGEETDTQDATGQVVKTAPTDHLTRREVGSVFASFLGESRQEPPMFSAIKVEGERLYHRARRGETISLPARTIHLNEFSLLEWEPPEARFRVRCSGGTYIRTLCRDAGRRCESAAHLVSLTRTGIGPFRLEAGLTVAAIQQAVREGTRPLPLIPLSDSLPHLTGFRFGREEARRIRQGRLSPPPAGTLPPGLQPGDPVKLLDEEGRLAAMATYTGPAEPMPLLRVFPEE